jgi:hypothetical protein
MSAAFGLRCQRDLAGRKQVPIYAAVISPYLSGVFSLQHSGDSLAFASVTVSRAKMQKTEEP